jgi:uncharacterized membrane protein
VDFYSILKLVHIGGAVAWVGGGVTFFALSETLTRRGDREGAMGLMKYLAVLGPIWFMPASLVTVLSGLALFWTGAWAFEGWSVLALVLVALAFGMGVGIVKPAGERAAALMAKGDMAGAERDVALLGRIGRIDVTAMVAIVMLMVLKPGWSDVVPMAAAVVAVVTVALAAVVSPRTAARA